MNEFDIMVSAGLSRGEANAYLAMLQLGTSTTGPIAAKAGISNAKVYPALDKLCRKGLAGFVHKGGVRHYSAMPPGRLLEYLQQKTNELQECQKRVAEIVPKLSKLREPEEYSAEMFFGLKGITNAAMQALEELPVGCEIISAGLRGDKNDAYNRLWIKWMRQAERKKIKFRYLVSDETPEYYKEYGRFKRTQSRTITGSYPAAFDVYGNVVQIYTYGDNPGCVVIRSKEIAQSFRNFFESMWKTGRTKPVQKAVPKTLKSRHQT